MRGVRLVSQGARPGRRRRDGRAENTVVRRAGETDVGHRARDRRPDRARHRGVPPYVIFHDTTLRDMVERRPKTVDDLHEVYGVGAKKATDFGDAFLDAIRTFRKPQ